MSDGIILALQQLKTQIEAIDPSPQPAPVAVKIYAYKPDEPINITKFPYIIIGQKFGQQTDIWQLKARNLTLHKWSASIDVFLGPRVLPEWEIEEMVRPWYQAMATAILADATLGNTAHYVGGSGSFDSELMTMETGHLHWYDQYTKKPESYWGIHFDLPITQQHNIFIGP